MLAVIIFAVLLVLILLDLPIAVAIALTAIGFFVGLDHASLLTMLPQRMYASTTGFVLLAVPFFILAGNLMNTGGVTNRIFAFARALGEYGSVVFISGNMPHRTEIVPLLIITKLEQYDYRGATALAVMMLVASFVLLLAINLLQKWSRRHHRV